MTNHPSFPAAAVSENVLDFPSTSGVSSPGEQVALDDHLRDSIPEGFTLQSDGLYQFRPGAGDDLVPVKICSPLLVKGRCRRPDGSGWGSVIALQDPDGRWNELMLGANDINGRPATA